MLAAILSILALAGGALVTFFIMDAPRRSALVLRRRLNEESERLRQAQEDHEARSKRLAAQVRDFRESEDALARRREEFQRRVISFDELNQENRLLKVDLRNMTLLVSRGENAVQEAESNRNILTQSRDSLGHEFLEEVRNSTRKALTANNYSASKRRIENAIQRLEINGIRPTPAGQQQLMNELKVLYEAAVRSSVEREEQARIREQIRDEQRREREAQTAIEQAEAERRAIARALQEALGQAANVHAAEIEELRTRLAEAEANSARAISQAQITRSGFVYVISNIGSFGKDVFKVGLTRRLEPMDRVHELGDASVPFPFDVHLMITADDAPKLEKALHHRFHKQRVNKTNPRKEFFRVTIDEVVAAVRELHGEVEYKADAEALQYIQSMNMTDEEVEEVEEAFEEATEGKVVADDEG